MSTEYVLIEGKGAFEVTLDEHSSVLDLSVYKDCEQLARVPDMKPEQIKTLGLHMLRIASYFGVDTTVEDLNAPGHADLRVIL